MTKYRIAIEVENLSKHYQVYESPNHRLKQFLLPKLYHLIGKHPKKYYSEFRALNNISFQVMKGETVGIIGRNGSGKSTLLQLICGTLTPTDGEVLTNGRIAALLELGSGFNPEFTGRDNVYMYASILGLSTQEVDQKFNDITSFADIGDFIEQPLKTYSSGMMIRLAFAVAINVEPEILIIDEALSVGDELFQRKCFAKIESIKKMGATILFVSHSASTIVQLCDKAILIDYGNMLLQGKPREVTKQYHKILFSNNPKEVANAIKTASASNHLEKNLSESTFSDFVSDLTATTPLRYDHDGGEIINFTFTDKNGEKVNIITSGFSGFVTLEVLFKEAFEDVVFGFHIKSVSGLELAGLSYPAINETGLSVTANEKITITWNVNIPFIAGAYFFTFGVRSLSREGFIDRIVDAMAIKVISKRDSSFFGLFDISENSQADIIRN